MERKFSQFMEENKENILCDLSDFIGIESESSNQAKIQEAMEYLLNLADEMGFRTESCLDGQVGVIEIGQGDETLGILSHLDVVPPGDLSLWKTDPFKATIMDGKMYGRGTLDDKGMIIAALYAMKAVFDKKEPFTKTVRLIIGTQEEVAWTDMEAYVKNYALPDYGFTPDGEYPLCNIEKGTVDIVMEFDIADDCQGVYVTAAEAGVFSNTTPEKAVATLSSGETIAADGIAVHSCQPEKGSNALLSLVKKLGGDLTENRLLVLLRAIGERFEDVYGKGMGLYSESEYFQGEYVHRNTMSPTIFKASGDKAVLTVNCRYPYGEELDHILSAFTKFCEAYDGKIIHVDNLPAVFISSNAPFLKVLADAYEEVSGRPNEFTLAYGGSYAKAMPNIVSWGPIFPGEEDTCHEVNEYIAINSLMTSTEIFANVISDIALSEKSFK